MSECKELGVTSESHTGKSLNQQKKQARRALYQPTDPQLFQIESLQAGYPYYAFFDLEFQSPIKKATPFALLSVGIVITDALCQPLETYSSLIQSEVPISPYVQKLTGLTAKKLKDAKPWPAIAKEIEECLSKYPGIQSVHFGVDDRMALNSCSNHYGIEQPFPNLRNLQSELLNLNLTRARVFDDRPSLNYLANQLLTSEEKHDDLTAHDALDDATLLARLAKRLRQPIHHQEIVYEFLRQLKRNTSGLMTFKPQATTQLTARTYQVLFNKSEAITLYVEDTVGYYLSATDKDSLSGGRGAFLTRMCYLDSHCPGFLSAWVGFPFRQEATLDEVYALYMEACRFAKNGGNVSVHTLLAEYESLKEESAPSGFEAALCFLPSY